MPKTGQLRSLHRVVVTLSVPFELDVSLAS
jgi:hypothetical protein